MKGLGRAFIAHNLALDYVIYPQGTYRVKRWLDLSNPYENLFCNLQRVVQERGASAYRIAD